MKKTTGIQGILRRVIFFCVVMSKATLGFAGESRRLTIVAESEQVVPQYVMLENANDLLTQAEVMDSDRLTKTFELAESIDRVRLRFSDEVNPKKPIEYRLDQADGSHFHVEIKLKEIMTPFWCSFWIALGAQPVCNEPTVSMRKI